MKIQLSLETKKVLDELSEYLVESRGEVEIKVEGIRYVLFERG